MPWLKEQNSKLIYFSGLLVILAIAIYFLGSYQHSNNVKYNDERITLEVENAAQKGIPTSIKFKYDLKGLEIADFIFYPDNFLKKQAKLIPGKNELFVLYQIPGVHKPKLYYKNRIVKEHKIILPTNNWQTYISMHKDDTKPIFIEDNNVKKEGIVFTTVENLEKYGIKALSDIYRTIYINCRNFGNNRI